jgi:hypothetical protein
LFAKGRFGSRPPDAVHQIADIALSRMRKKIEGPPKRLPQPTVTNNDPDDDIPF